MIPMKVIKNGNSPLSVVAEEVREGEDVSTLLDSMWATMYASKGIGLAANQVGELKRVFVMHANGLKQEFINPVITKSYGGKTTNREGCLSYPGVTVPVIRYKQVIVNAFDRKGKPFKRKLKGLAAFCAQHEIDHLDGITIA
jgi:peptide deformylase